MMRGWGTNGGDVMRGRDTNADEHYSLQCLSRLLWSVYIENSPIKVLDQYDDRT